MTAFLKDMRYAVRTLWHTPAFTLIAVLTIAVGIGANTAIFSVVRTVLLSPLPFPQSEELVMVGGQLPGLGSQDLTASPAEFRDYRDQATSMDNLAATWIINVNVTSIEQPFRAQAVLSTSNLFTVLGQPPMLGRDFNEDDAGGDIGFVTILSYRAWQRYFNGDPAAIGQTIRVDDDPFEIIGVMPEGFTHPGESPTSPVDIWGVFDLLPGTRFDFRAFRPLNLIGRLGEGVTVASSEAEFQTIASALREEYPTVYPAESGWTVSVVPLLDRVVGDSKMALLLVFGSAGLVLLLACTNVANLLLTRGSFRSREIAIRSALGGGRTLIVQQFLAESVVLGLAGGAVGVALAVGGTAVIKDLALAYVPRLGTVSVDGPALVFALTVSILASILFGLLPAIRLSKSDSQSLLKEGALGASVGKSALRKGLVVAEVTIAIILLAGSGLLIKSFDRLMSVDPGFQADSVMTFKTYLPFPNVPENGAYFTQQARITFFDEALRQLEATPQIKQAGLINQLPLRDQNGLPFGIEGLDVDPDAPPLTAEYRVISPNYFAVMGIPVLRGKAIDEFETVDTPLLSVVDEAFAEHYFPGQEAIGKRLRIGNNPNSPWREIVGIVGNVRQHALDAQPRETIYSSYRQGGTGIDLTFVVQPNGTNEGVIPAGTAVIQGIDPELPMYAAVPMKQVVADTVALRRLLTLLLSLFAAVAAFLAALGIYGVQSYAVASRTREIGIRMALGARDASVMGMVLKEGLTLAGFGVVIGLAISAVLSRTLSSVLYQVQGIDPVVFAAVSVFTIGVTALATSVPARRATRVDPIVTMKSE
jgi:putative ABC transport system permease protein